MMKKLLEGVSELDYSKPDVVKAGRSQPWPIHARDSMAGC